MEELFLSYVVIAFAIGMFLGGYNFSLSFIYASCAILQGFRVEEFKSVGGEYDGCR